MARIRITIGEVVVTAKLDRSNTARPLVDALPFKSTAQVWGDEVYFTTPVKTGEEDARDDVPSGSVAYWPPGNALCLFFGQKPFSPVNVVGEIEGDTDVLREVAEGDAVRVEQA